MAMKLYYLLKLTIFQKLNIEYLQWLLKLQQFVRVVKDVIEVNIATMYATFTLSYLKSEVS